MVASDSEKQGMPVITTTIHTARDERLKKTNAFVKLLRRPEVGAFIAALAIFIFFSAIAPTFLQISGVTIWVYSGSLFGIMAVPVALLMIGGEYDLSSGVVSGTSALLVGALTTSAHWNIGLALLTSLAVAVVVGIFNGFMTMKTRLPSFIVTLGTMFILMGLNLAGTKILTGQVAIQGMTSVPGYNIPKIFFGSQIPLFGAQFKVSILWWIGITVLATWVLLRTRFGNWTFAVGGQVNSARQVGVPVLATKVTLFVATSVCGWLIGMLSLFDVGTVQASMGAGNEFIYIICAVVGGCLLTGGYGSAVGASIGALIYGMGNQGIVFAQWDNNWLRTFLGVLLLLAVLINTFVRRRAGSRD